MSDLRETYQLLGEALLEEISAALEKVFVEARAARERFEAERPRTGE